MLHNIDKQKMNQLMDRDKDAKIIINQLLENHNVALSTIAHEIRNPLTLVYSALQVMEIQHPELSTYPHWSQTKSDIEFMCQLLNDLSRYSSGHTLNHSAFSMKDFLKNIAVSFAISLEDSNIEFTSRIDKGLGTFTGDKIKLKEVLLNLLANARDAVQSVHSGDGRGKICLSAHPDIHGILIECFDNGCGISDDIIDHIFDPFVTHKENGTGLGLAISRQIIESHNGSIQAHSSPETGTTFIIHLAC